MNKEEIDSIKKNENDYNFSGIPDLVYYKCF